MLVKGSFILYVMFSFYVLDNSIVPWVQEEGMGVCHTCVEPSLQSCDESCASRGYGEL